MEELNEVYFSERAKLYVELSYHVQLNKTFEFTVQSGDYSGKTTFCIHVLDLNKIIAKLDEMKNSLNGECTINDADSNNFLKLYFKEDNLIVEGLFTDFSEHTLTFAFSADQTILTRLSNILK